MPQELIEAGGAIRFEYQGPLNQAQRASVGMGILNALQAVTPLAQIDPTVTKLFDIVGCARELAEINMVPERLLRSDDEIDAMAEQDAQAAAAQQLLQAAPVAASAAKDFAQAQAMGGANQTAPAVLPQGA